MQTDARSPEPIEILIVDDIEASRTDLAKTVAALGFKVRAVGSGQAALDLIAATPPDLVLLDLLMPELDGFEVTRRIREQETGEQWLPVIVLSSMQGEAHFDHALRQGADDCLTRPVHPHFLEAKLRHYTRLLQMQQALRASAQRQRDMTDHIQDPVITVDEHGTLRDANWAACARFGDGTPASILGIPCREAVGHELPSLLRTRELQLQAFRGTEFPAEVRCSEWLDRGQRRYTMVLRDLSEQRAIDRLKDEFLATINHELRTPLTSLQGALQLLVAGKGGELPGTAARLVDMASRNAVRLGRLIDDVFEITQVESNRMPVVCREHPIGPLLAEAVAAHQGLAIDRGLSLLADWTQADAQARVHVDPDRLAQVLANLISNAAKHSPPQGRIFVRLTIAGPWVRLSVLDEGPGVPEDFRSRVFDKFTQAEGGDARAGQGLGLGLYVCRLLVERMGGRIHLGAPLKGCEVCVELPHLAEHEESVLWVIDTDRDSAQWVQRSLSPRWRVLHAPHVEALLQQAGGARPSAVLTDPQGQGDIDRFVQRLLHESGWAPLLLFTDAVDRSYADRQGWNLLRKAQGEAATLERSLRRLLNLSTHWQDLQ